MMQNPRVAYCKSPLFNTILKIDHDLCSKLNYWPGPTLPNYTFICENTMVIINSCGIDWYRKHQIWKSAIILIIPLGSTNWHCFIVVKSMTIHYKRAMYQYTRTSLVPFGRMKYSCRHASGDDPFSSRLLHYQRIDCFLFLIYETFKTKCCTPWICWNIDAWIKWLLFCIWYFQIRFIIISLCFRYHQDCSIGMIDKR